MESQITFVVPKERGRLAKVLWEENAEMDGVGSDPYETAEEYESLMADAEGNTLTASFEDERDPLTPVFAVANALDEVDGVYVGVSPHFEEMSRRIKVPGQFVVRLEDAHGSERFFLEIGQDGPHLELPNMKAAGMTEEFARSALEIAMGRDIPGASPKAI
jgi:hypothetical protein